MASPWQRASILSLLLLPFLSLGCDRREAEPWQVEIGGCETWLQGPVCAIGNNNLRIWITGNTKVEVSLDGQRLALQPESFEGGQKLEIQVPSTARQLTLERSRSRPFELKLTTSQRPEWYETVRSAYFSDLEEAKRILGQTSELNPVDRAWKLVFKARIANREGNHEAAANLNRQAADQWAAAGFPSQAIYELVMGARIHSNDAAYEESRALLAQAKQHLEALRSAEWLPWEPAFQIEHEEANLAFLTGDIRTALAHHEKLAAYASHKIAANDELFLIENLHAQLLATLGRFDDALAALDRLQGLQLNARQDADVRHNYGWLCLLALLADQPAKDPRPFFKEAWTYYENNGSGQQKLITRLNQAEVELEAGRLKEAREFFAEAETWRSHASALERFDLEDLAARLLLAEGHAQAALDVFQALDIVTNRQRQPEQRWRALTGKAVAMAALGQAESAIEVFESTRQLEAQSLLFIPFDGGRETFLARRGRSTRLHLRLLMERAESEKAYQLVRQHRAQTLRLLQRYELLASLDPAKRRLWDRAATEYRKTLQELEQNAEVFTTPGSSQETRRSEGALARGATALGEILDKALAELGLPATAASAPGPQEGQLTVAFFPLEASWLLFAERDDGTVRVERQDGRELALVAPVLLARIRPEIEASRRLKILPWGELDFHALNIGEVPLLAIKPLVYGVDVQGAVPSVTSEGPLRALLVMGDPRKDLSRPPKELENARKTLELRGIQIGAKLLFDQAEAAVVRAELEKADYFHFAGHSYFNEAAGSQSLLSLGMGDLKASDIFTLERVPRQVVLSSCSSGQAKQEAGVEGLGLAQAFILSGSRQVLATSRVVNDRDAASLIEALYSYLDSAPGEIDLAVALQQAQLKQRETAPGSDWQAFRVFEP